MFLHLSVILFTGRGSLPLPSMHHRSHDQGICLPGGLHQGRPPTPRKGRPPPTIRILRDTVNKRAVRILLECLLVWNILVTVRHMSLVWSMTPKKLLISVQDEVIFYTINNFKNINFDSKVFNLLEIVFKVSCSFTIPYAKKRRLPLISMEAWVVSLCASKGVHWGGVYPG